MRSLLKLHDNNDDDDREMLGIGNVKCAYIVLNESKVSGGLMLD